MSTIKWLPQTITSLMTTELNALANSTGVIQTTGYDNATNLYEFGMFELNVTFGTNPTAGAPIELYLIPALDGTNYDDGSATILPLNSYVGSFLVRAVTTAQKLVVGLPFAIGAPSLVLLPPVPFKAIINNKSGQAFPATSSTLKMVPFQRQVV